MKNSPIRAVSVLGGVGALVLGALLLLWPQRTLRSMVVLAAAFLLVESVVAIASAYKRRGLLAPLRIATGAIGVLVAIFLLVRPNIALSFAAVLLGLWAIMAGFSMLFMRQTHGGRLLPLIAGVAVMAAGVFFLFERSAAVTTIGYWLGAAAIVVGLVQLYWTLRPESKTANAPLTSHDAGEPLVISGEVIDTVDADNARVGTARSNQPRLNNR